MAIDDDNLADREWLRAFDESIDKISIPDQVALLSEKVDHAHALMYEATRLIQKIGQASDAGVLRPEEADEFIRAALEKIVGLQVFLIIMFSGHNSDREVLEQLHHIYYPNRGPGTTRSPTLDRQLLYIRSGGTLEELKTDGLVDSKKIRYWERLYKYAEEHPDEPEGWRDRM